MLAADQVFVREILRDFAGPAMDIASNKLVAGRMADYGVDYEWSVKFMNRLTPAKDNFAYAGLQLLYDHRVKLLDYLRRNQNHTVAGYLECLFGKYLTPDGKAGRSGTIYRIFHHWNNHRHTGDSHIKSGVYQIFRRYKPRRPMGPDRDSVDVADPNDVLIVELLYFDADTMESFIVTSEGNVYWGTAHLNDDATLAMIFQRPSVQTGVDVRHRFVTIHAKHPEARTPDLYSGLYLKAGDSTKRPLAGEAIFTLLDRQAHKALYDRLAVIFQRDYGYLILADQPDIMAYIAAYDGAGNAHARLGDVPFIDLLTSAENSAGTILLREPLRTTNADYLEGVRRAARGQPTELPTFRRDGVCPPASD